MKVRQALPKGSEVTLKVTVTHSANSATHYTEWVKVTANGKEIARWNFTSGQRPEGSHVHKRGEGDGCGYNGNQGRGEL